MSGKSSNHIRKLYVSFCICRYYFVSTVETLNLIRHILYSFCKLLIVFKFTNRVMLTGGESLLDKLKMRVQFHANLDISA
jgi:hypothetical protein